jgi:hypothetical protein
MVRLLEFIRKPLIWQWREVSWLALALVPPLLGLLVAILFWQFQSGLLTWEAGRFALRLVGVFLLLPGLIGVMVVRSRPFQILESRATNLPGVKNEAL